MNSATLHVMLSRKFGSSVNYDAEKHELSARCGVEGYVWNTDTKFDAKRCSVSFYRGSTDGLSPFACEHGLREACGSVTLSADLEPEKFIADGHDFSLPPIEIVIVLGDDAYAKTENLVRSCITNGLEPSLSLEFSHRNFTERFVTLDDIDVQSKSTYPVIGFNIGRAGQENTFVHCPRYEYDSKTAANLSFVAVGVSIQTSVWNSEFSISEIKLNGQLRCTRFGISADDDVLEIREYERAVDYQMGYPEEAFPGVVSVSKTETDLWCSVTLYATRDTLNRIAALLSGLSKGDTVRFDVSMFTDGVPLEVGTKKFFDVTGYTPTISKSFT